MMVNTIYHHGIKGMKWGVRRYQNYDGSYTKSGTAANAVLGIKSFRENRRLRAYYAH